MTMRVSKKRWRRTGRKTTSRKRRKLSLHRQLQMPTESLWCIGARHASKPRRRPARKGGANLPPKQPEVL
jgi:hypothetical protein